MATHSIVLAWRIPWTEEPGRLQSMGSQSGTQLKQLSTHTQGDRVAALATQVEQRVACSLGITMWGWEVGRG